MWIRLTTKDKIRSFILVIYKQHKLIKMSHTLESIILIIQCPFYCEQSSWHKCFDRKPAFTRNLESVSYLQSNLLFFTKSLTPMCQPQLLTRTYTSWKYFSTLDRTLYCDNSLRMWIVHTNHILWVMNHLVNISSRAVIEQYVVWPVALSSMKQPHILLLQLIIRN